MYILCLFDSVLLFSALGLVLLFSALGLQTLFLMESHLSTLILNVKKPVASGEQAFSTFFPIIDGQKRSRLS